MTIKEKTHKRTRSGKFSLTDQKSKSSSSSITGSHKEQTINRLDLVSLQPNLFRSKIRLGLVVRHSFPFSFFFRSFLVVSPQERMTAVAFLNRTLTELVQPLSQSLIISKSVKAVIQGIKHVQVSLAFCWKDLVFGLSSSPSPFCFLSLSSSLLLPKKLRGKRDEDSDDSGDDSYATFASLAQSNKFRFALLCCPCLLVSDFFFSCVLCGFYLCLQRCNVRLWRIQNQNSRSQGQSSTFLLPPFCFGFHFSFS
jgi:hypothetical protein